MIPYNFCYRGPHEYDKFVLNYLQLHNAIMFLEGDSEGEPGQGALQSLKKQEEKIDESYREATGEEKVYGIYTLFLTPRLSRRD